MNFYVLLVRELFCCLMEENKRTIYKPISVNKTSSNIVNNVEIPLISKKRFKELTSLNEVYIIDGIITPFTANKKKKGVIRNEKDRVLVLDINERPGLFTKLKGYVQVGNNIYLKYYEKNYLLLVTLLIVLISLLVIVFLLRPNNEQTSLAPLDIDTSQQDYVAPEKQVNHSKNIVMPGWEAFTIEANTTDITKGIDMYNPSSNRWYKCPKCEGQLDDNLYCEECEKQYSKDEAIEDLYYMSFALVLEDNDEVIYQSKLVEPDKHLQHITLTRPLEKGTYDAYVLIKPYKSDMATECNNGKVMITLNVK